MANHVYPLFFKPSYCFGTPNLTSVPLILRPACSLALPKTACQLGMVKYTWRRRSPRWNLACFLHEALSPGHSTASGFVARSFQTCNRVVVLENYVNFARVLSLSPQTPKLWYLRNAKYDMGVWTPLPIPRKISKKKSLRHNRSKVDEESPLTQVHSRSSSTRLLLWVGVGGS
jgi:hypothetical protein